VRLATIDIGTNTLLLLVAESAPGGELRIIADRMRIERLGKGVDRTGVLDEERLQASLEALREFAGVIGESGVDRVAAVGTQALREAKNGADFLGPAAEILGVPVEVIAGEREAQLAFTAVARSFPALSGTFVVCDVGGGSTELVVARAGVVESMVSIPIGSVRLAERHLTGDPPEQRAGQALHAAIDAALAAVTLPHGLPLVGTAGTVTTLASVALGLERYDPDRIQGMRLPRAVVERQLARYLELRLDERRRLPGLDPKRADVIPAGAAIVARVMAAMGAEEMIVSDRGIRWGLAYELAG
jgi:exopolyphosphatase / guanosine-5'-triphosphate,3'-diphosphate pyrophosphatase